MTVRPVAATSAPQGPSPLDRFAVVRVRLEALGERYDLAPAFPRSSLDLLRGAGLHRTYAPRAAGGDPFGDASTEASSLLDLLRAVGRADLSLGRIFEGHVNALQLFGWYGTPDQIAWLREALSQGHWFGVWATEPAPGVRIERSGSAETLVGSKVFATGAGGLDHALVTAAEDASGRSLVIVPADRAERADLTGWRVRGMKATTSGLYDLTGIPVAAANRLGGAGAYDREPRFTAGAWRFTAVQLGGIEGLLVAMREAMPTAARADPLHRARFGAAVAAARTAYLWVREAGARAVREDADAPMFALMTRGVVERAALDVMELAARTVGTRSAFEGERVDKITRDLSLYLRQAGPDHARDSAASAWLERDIWGQGDGLW